MCSYMIENGDRDFGNMYLNNNQQVRQLTYGCRTSYEYCCGMECCKYGSGGRGRGFGGFVGLIFLIVMGIACCAGCGFLFKKYRRNQQFSNVFQGSQKFDAVPMQPATYQAPQATYQVPMAYPNQYAPGYNTSAATYPSQPSYPNPPYSQYPTAGYPSQPYPPATGYPQQTPYPTA